MPPTFHGLMTEDISYAFDNRIFKETVPAGGGGGHHWSVISTVRLAAI